MSKLFLLPEECGIPACQEHWYAEKSKKQSWCSNRYSLWIRNQQLQQTKSCKFKCWNKTRNPFPQFWVIVHHIIFQRDCFQPRIVLLLVIVTTKLILHDIAHFYSDVLYSKLIIIIILLNEMFLSRPERSEQPITNASRYLSCWYVVHQNGWISIFTWLWHQMKKL